MATSTGNKSVTFTPEVKAAVLASLTDAEKCALIGTVRRIELAADAFVATYTSAKDLKADEMPARLKSIRNGWKKIREAVSAGTEKIDRLIISAGEMHGGAYSDVPPFIKRDKGGKKPVEVIESVDF